MRKTFFIIAALAAILSSCSKQDENPPSGKKNTSEGATLSLSFDSGTPSIKAIDNTRDAALNDVQVLMFNSRGETYRYSRLTAEEVSEKKCLIKEVKAGTYSVSVIANGPTLSEITSLPELLKKEIPLEIWNSPLNDFIMDGHADSVKVVESKDTSAPISLSRHIGRITISKIENNIPSAFGNMTLNYALLTNAVANQNIGGNAPAEEWINRDCVFDEAERDSTHIIDGDKYPASCPDLTFHSYSGKVIANRESDTEPVFLYAYPNSITSKGDGYSDPFTPKGTYVVLSISFNGHTYFYPVLLKNGVKRNTDIDVRLKISGEGGEDPFQPLKKGAFTSLITVTEWSEGEKIDTEL